MEDVVNKLARTGSTLATHPDFRMTVPPRSSKGKTYEDLGQTDYKNTRAVITYRGKRGQKPSPKKNVEDDDDELDLLSGGSRDEDRDTEPPRKKVNRKTRKAENRSKTRTRQEEEPFPLSSPAPDSDPQSTPRPVEKASTRNQSSFPALQPLDDTTSTTKKKPADFPAIPPLSPKNKSKKKPRSRSSDGSRSGSEDDDADELSLHPDDDIKTRGAPRPFPMPKELLKSIGNSPSPPRVPPKAGPSKSVPKKSSRKLAQFPMSTQMLKSIPSKASPERCPAPLYPTDYDGDEHEDSFFAPPSTDPRKLCPYCDALLPPSPTPTFMHLLSRANKHKSSHHDPRPGNTLGRRAPLPVFVVVCQRHRFENDILPEAERRGWPKSIDWGKLRGRVEKMRASLQALINDQGDATSSGNQDEAGGRRPRERSVFWREVIKEVEAKGSRAVAGVQGQFATFEKTQPGYYGELGYLIIHQTLYNLFPPSEFDPILVAPLTPGEFIQRILVPEVGVRLIMDDKNLTGNGGADKALAILRESANYGVAMFPEDGGEWGDVTRKGDDDGDGESDEMGAADMIVMERARKRRQELEVEEMLEDAAGKSGRKTKPRAKEKEKEKPKRSRKKKPHDDKAQDSSDTHQPDPTPRPKPRPRPLPKPTFEPGETDDSKSDDVDKHVTSDGGDLDLSDGFPTFQSTSTHANLTTPRATPLTNKQESTSQTQPNGHTKDRDRDRSKPSFCVYIQSSPRRHESQPTPRESAKAKGKKKAESTTDEEVEVVETCSISPRTSGRRKEAEDTPRPVQMGSDRHRNTSHINGHGHSSKSSIGEDRSLCPLMVVKQRKKKPVSNSKGGDWKYSMATSIDGSDEELAVGMIADKENFDWLLNDCSDEDQKRGMTVY